MFTLSSARPLSVAMVLVLSFLWTHAPQAQAQSLSPQERIQAAQQTMASGDMEGGISALESVTEDHADFGPGWMALGQALRAASRNEASRDAFLEAARITPESGPIAFQVGAAYMILDDHDPAFEWLLKAKESGQVLTANISFFPASSNISDDARFSQLFPADSEYADPFVEQTAIIQDWYGENARDVFGWIARAIGDVDGDGLSDVTTSSPGFNGQAGKVYVYSSGTGELIWSVQGDHPGGRLGHGIESAGDVNGDGIGDVVAAAPYVNRVRVFSGRDGSQLWESTGADTTGAYGLSVKGVGDLNGDGLSDILVGEPHMVWGAPINGGDGSSTGQAHILSGRDGSTLLTLDGEHGGDAFGSSVSGATDSNGSLFIVGAPGAGTLGTGKAFVYSGLDATPHFVSEPDSLSAQYGSMFLSVVGDLNADGMADVYISDWGDNSVAPGAGKVYLYSGQNGERLYSLAGESAGDGYGIGISDAGDVNGDGYDDLVVGAWQHASAALSGGKLYIHSGKDGALMHTVTGDVAGETLGFDTTGIGDIDGDGTVDFLITSAYSMRNGFQAGRTLIVSGRNPSH